MEIGWSATRCCPRTAALLFAASAKAEPSLAEIGEELGNPPAELERHTRLGPTPVRTARTGVPRVLITDQLAAARLLVMASERE